MADLRLQRAPEFGGAMVEEKEERKDTRDPSRARMSRDLRLDAIKGVAIAMVVLGHALYGGLGPDAANNPVTQVIESFNMPLFMFLSGWVLWRPGRDGLGAPGFVAKRARRLLVPYFVWLVPYYVVYRQQIGVRPLDFFLGAVIDPNGFGKLWFLYVLFVGSVLLFALRRVFADDSLMAAGCILVWCVTGIGFFGGLSGFGILNLQWLFPFLALGYFASRMQARAPTERMRIVMSAVTPACYVFLMAIAGTDAMRGSLVAPLSAMSPIAARAFARLLRYAVAFGGIAGVFVMAGWLTGHARRILALVGEASLGIYVMHGLFSGLAMGTGWARVASMMAVTFGLGLLSTHVLRVRPVLRRLSLGEDSAKSAAA